MINYLVKLPFKLLVAALPGSRVIPPRFRHLVWVHSAHNIDKGTKTQVTGGDGLIMRKWLHLRPLVVMGNTSEGELIVDRGICCSFASSKDVKNVTNDPSFEAPDWTFSDELEVEFLGEDEGEI